MPQDTQQFQAEIDRLTARVEHLERISIQLDIDPNTSVYLDVPITAGVAKALALQPTVTYSTSLPSGLAVNGSTWYYDTGLLATREIYIYQGSWIKFK